MEKLYEELDGLKAENEKLRVDCKRKSELSDNLKKAHNEQLVKIQEFSSKIEKQAQELLEKEGEISTLRGGYEDLKRSFSEKESAVKHLGAANEKLRADYDEKNRNWEEERRRLVLALDEENEKSIDQEQKINVLRAEMEGLKELLSVSQKKCSEAEKRVKISKELRERDDVVFKLEEENRKVEDKLKWKMEQFKHLEEAHGKLRDQFKASQKEWEQEKSTLVDEICSLQTKLDAQISISKDLEHRLKLCNQALAHEETRRKYLEVEVSDFRSRFENVYAEFQDSKSQLEQLSARRDEEVATLRHTLGKKEAFYKEMEYRAAKLEQENQELLMSLREAQEAGIQEAGSSSSLLKLRNKLRSVEQIHRDCSKTLQAKEAEWTSQMEKMTEELDYSRSQLETRDAELEELKKESDACLSSAMQLKLQNEELSVMLLVLKSGIYDAQLQLGDIKGELGLHEKDREEKVLLLQQQLEMKNVALAEAQRDIEKEQDKTSALLKRVESLEVMEEQHDLMQKELLRCKEMLEESSRCQLHLKQQALQVESDSREELRKLCDALDVANSELTEEREKVASLSRKVQSLELVEEKQILMQKELETHKNLLEEASKNQLCLEERAFEMENHSKEKLQDVCSALDAAKSELAEAREKADSLTKRVEFFEMENQSKENLQEVCSALDAANSELAEEREKADSLTKRVEALEHIDEQLTVMQKELEKYKEMYERSSQCQDRLKEQLLQVEGDSEERFRDVFDALDKANSELAEEREKAHSLTRRVEFLEHVEEQLNAMQKELERYKEMLEESSRRQRQLEEQLREVEDSLEKANSALVEKPSEGHEIEFESWIWRSIAEQLKASLEDNRMLRKELEASLLAEAEDGENIKKEKDDLVRTLEEKDSRLTDLQQQVSLLEQELKSVNFSTMETATSFESEKGSLFQNTQEKDKILDDLSEEIDRLEQESFRRELLAAAFAHIGAERTLMQEKEDLVQLLKKKDQKIDSLMQTVKSLEERSSLQLAEAREEIARAEILAQLEIEKKKLMISELEDNIQDLQAKLVSQEKSLSDSKQLAVKVEAELEAKQLEIKNLTDEMEEKLKTSDALINELRFEKGNLLEEVMNLHVFVGSMGDSISKLSGEDTQLMGMLGRIVQSCDDSVVPSNGNHEVFVSVKENILNIPSPKTKKVESFAEERSPFRLLN